MIDRHEACVGIRLFKSSKRFIQLWYCPSGYTIWPHSHNQEDIELMYVFGKTTFYRFNNLREETFKPKWFNIFRTFSVKAGVVHWFTVSSLPLIFINFATFKQGYKPVSAAVDFNNK